MGSGCIESMMAGRKRLERGFIWCGYCGRRENGLRINTSQLLNWGEVQRRRNVAVGGEGRKEGGKRLVNGLTRD